MSRVTVHVDLPAVHHNLSAIRRVIGPKPKILAVIKADAYGHGAVAVARSLIQAGQQQFAVATADEALELRHSGISQELLVLGPVFDSARYAALFKANVQVMMLHADSQRLIVEAQEQSQTRARVHLKVDTGMHRYGFEPNEVASVLASLPKGIKVEALASHFAQAEEPEFTKLQEQRLTALRTQLKSQSGLDYRWHIANSAGCVFRDAREDSFVRPGIALYGIDPTGRFADHGLKLRPAMSVQSRISSVKLIPGHEGVGYGLTFKTRAPTQLALVSLGYGDGWRTKDSNCGHVLIHGQLCPVVGTVMMDGLAVDVSHLPRPPRFGDTVTLIGHQGQRQLSMESVAHRVETIPYDIPCTLTARAPRHYREAGSLPMQREPSRQNASRAA